MFKKTESKEVISKALDLYKIIQNRKTIEAQEKELKEFFKASFPDGVVAGEILVTTKECTRENLDKKQLIMDFGDDKIAKYLSETNYVQVDVKRVAG